MLLPARRRESTSRSIMILLSTFLFFASTANAASSVLGLDFGTLNLKAALVKPGIPLDIVLTKDSKRKETAALAFKPHYDSNKNIVAEIGTFPERLYGGDALALQGRIPGEVFPNLKPLLGNLWSEAGVETLETYKQRFPAIQADHDKSTDATVFRSSAFAETEGTWSIEELLAMQLASIRQNAENMAGKGNVVEDVVITVPSFYTADERAAIRKAAALAKLEVIGLVSDGLAVGVDYAKSRTFPEVSKGEKPEYHLVFDMGAGSTTATVLRFQARSVKDVGRYNKTVQEVAVLGTGWDRSLGGDALNHIIVTDYIYKFCTKPVMKSRGIESGAVWKNARAMSRLWKEAEKARQVLSANTETSSSFEELLPEVDFRAKLTRAEFETLSSDFAERVANPINDALKAAELSIADLDSVILHGGAGRTPFIQRKLEELVGGTKLRSNVNADESAVFGAAFKAAGLSPSFKVKEIRDSDIAGYPAGMRYNDSAKERKQVLFIPTSPVGNGATTKQVTFKDKDDFSFTLFQQVDGVDRDISRIETLNLTAGVKALKDNFGCDKDDMSTKFSIKLSSLDGLPAVVGGSVSCEVVGSGKGESLGDSVKGWLGLGKKDQEPLNEDDGLGPIEEVDATVTASASPASDSSSATSSASKAPEKPKKRTERVTVAFSVSPESKALPEEFMRMQDRLAAFDRSDRARYAREEALNVLEAFTYQARDFLSNEDYSTFSTSAQREDISSLLSSTRAFMEDSKAIANANESTLREKLEDLKSLIEPIQSRRKEQIARPEKIDSFKKSLEQAKSLLEQILTTIVDASSKASAASESVLSSSTAESSSTASTDDPQVSSSSSNDEFADLEDPESETTSGSTTTQAPPKPSSFSDFSPYRDTDLARLQEAYDSASSWLQEKESEQAKLSAHEDPALLVAEIESEANKLGDVTREMLYKKIKTPPRFSAGGKSKTSKSKKTKSNSAASSSTVKEGDETSTASDGPSKPFITIGPDDEMPSEEEILKMVSEVKAKTGRSERDEL